MSTLLPEVNEELLAMLGRQSDPVSGDHPYLDHLRRDSFYGFLALHRNELFSDEDFAHLYCLDNGRPSVPPSLLATALLLQAYESISEEEAKARRSSVSQRRFPDRSRGDELHMPRRT